jgi:hypothetical protein
VSSESSSVGFGGLLDNNVGDVEVLKGDVLGLGVGLGVLEETEDDSNRLCGPSSLGGGEATSNEPS